MDRSESKQLKILFIGAHPDDPEFAAGGVVALYSRLGHKVKCVSLTNGDAGHHEIGGIELARRRYQEAQEAAKVLGVAEYRIFDNHDGELEPSLNNRREVIRVIREFEPDLILCARPNDYHPDHRYSSLLVQDAAYMVTVPNILPLTPHLRVNPVIAYVDDDFQKPYPFAPDVVVDIDGVIDKKFDALHCHTSQVYEWLPYNERRLQEVPAGDGERREWLVRAYGHYFKDVADRHRQLLIQRYGVERGSQVQYAEAFEGCEYGTRLTGDLIVRLFPFL
ncbi:MAG: PIG-L family deacetylase [Chloroflexi bacterium]|nr:PIG-L family deacetylase [Chloroflexota bacterium]